MHQKPSARRAGLALLAVLVSGLVGLISSTPAAASPNDTVITIDVDDVSMPGYRSPGNCGPTHDDPVIDFQAWLYRGGNERAHSYAAATRYDAIYYSPYVLWENTSQLLVLTDEPGHDSYRLVLRTTITCDFEAAVQRTTFRLSKTLTGWSIDVDFGGPDGLVSLGNVASGEPTRFDGVDRPPDQYPVRTRGYITASGPYLSDLKVFPDHRPPRILPICGVFDCSNIFGL